MKTRYIAYTLITVVALVFSACDSYLDVQPEAQFSESRMFADEEGFKDGLYGIYHTMISDDLYGKEMTWGTMDALAHYYPVRASDYYAKTVAYDYTDNKSRSNLDKIWAKSYSAIANANNVLLNLDKWEADRLEYYDYYKGEVLALRAFLHFELYRCFGPVSQTETILTIPYVKDFTNKTPPQVTVAELYQSVIADLKTALIALAEDPILNGAEEQEVNSSDVYFDSFLTKRMYKMNYLAVKSLLARVYYTKGEYTEALKYAQEVIDDVEKTGGKIRLTNQDDWKGEDPNQLMTPEIIM